MQGVFFRRFAADRAATLHINGFARNLLDGRTVEVVAQGNKDNILEYIEQLKKGPPGALVEGIELEELPDSAGFNQFSIK